MNIDINCDLGEGSTAEDCARDALLMPYISRCNIACGGHAGNQETMAISLKNAAKHQLSLGAHPGYPDPENFGRKSLQISEQELVASVAAQIQALADLANQQGAVLGHVKLHGALYNDAEANPELAALLTELIHRDFPDLHILGLANGAMEAAAKSVAHPFIREGFMDRRYLNKRQLSPRSMPGAVIEDFDHCIQQTLGLIRGDGFPSIDDNELTFTADSICLHGDNPNAVQIAEKLVDALQRENICVGA
ncbi:5-oxoprolinase subunit PxpA [Microbulbifer agarilyticus]|uniref:5-oxoprolinase subunit PxpA n=1 Tax=Microbulbifer agarilyticus TaxID=260552 RepID=UPI001C9866E1|nr:5-oxoprolinase subunit PxpA [Microbulbifer agarilyticus]MBY6191789.1 5-oxoprolinase subunit PxpA [Microbulbifer agarilyticus]MBY6212907.1 5-oxoprolinase subunit PxpA [Microbulbifer agarilyticus]